GRGGDPSASDARGYAAIRGHHEPAESWVARRSATITPGADTGPDFRAAAVDALLLRSGVRVAEPHPAARDVSASVVDLARTCLSRAGRTYRGGKEELLRRAMTTSDFPLILVDA